MNRLQLAGWMKGRFMLLPRFVAWTSFVATMVLGTGVVYGQNYPNKSIRIVTSEAGGGADFVARLVGGGISSALGQQVVIENRPSGVIPPQTVSKANPDGYTLLVYGSTVWLLPLLRSNVPYDPVRDLAAISLATSATSLLVVHPSMPISSVKELITLAKAKPGELNWSSASAGSATHIAGELFRTMAGINIVRIPYKGTAPMLNDLIAGFVQLSFPNAAIGLPHVKSGRLRALAVTSAKPSSVAPGLPTVAASGVPGYESAAPAGVYAPGKTPEAIINRLNQEIVRALNRPSTKERLLNLGNEVVGNSPEEFAAFIKYDMARMSKLFKEAGIHEE